MGSIINYAVNGWWDDYGHPALNDRLPGGPWHLVAISAIYVAFVTKIGPAIMKHRQPAAIERLIQTFNLVNIVINSVLLAAGVYFTNWTADCWICEKYDPGPTVRLWSDNAHLYLKIFDLLDTVFFVLRKKQSHVTTLHVWHHASMPVLTWMVLKFYPVTEMSLVYLLNTSVHILMYVYYYMAADPVLRQHLWWKKYITMVQMVQFAILFVQGLVVHWPCGMPFILWCTGMAQDSYMLYAFGRFYWNSYIKKKSQ